VHIFTARAQKRLFIVKPLFRSKIWPRRSLRRPRFPIRQMPFHYRVTFTGYIRCFCATATHDLVTLTFWPWECLMYSASHVRPTYQFWLSYDYRLLSYEYWIFDHISAIWNSHCACAVSRDLCMGGPSKPHVTIFWPRIAYSLYNFYGATMTIKGSLYWSIPMLMRFSVAKKKSSQNRSPKWRFLEI